MLAAIFAQIFKEFQKVIRDFARILHIACCMNTSHAACGVSSLIALLIGSDSVTRVSDSTRVTICGDSDSSQVEKNGDSTPLE